MAHKIRAILPADSRCLCKLACLGVNCGKIPVWLASRQYILKLIWKRSTTDENY